MVMTEERTSEREDISIETARIEVNREDKKKKNTQLWDSYKSYMTLCDVNSKKGKEKRTEGILETIMTENSLQIPNYRSRKL